MIIFCLDYFFSVVSLLVWFSASLAVSNNKNKFPGLAAEQDDSWIPTIVSVSRPLRNPTSELRHSCKEQGSAFETSP